MIFWQVKKSKSKGKKVHLFRDGFTLPSAEEQEDSDPGFFGMTHDYWSDQVLSPLISEPSATQFPVSHILPVFASSLALLL
jgi:hypothetical protein